MKLAVFDIDGTLAATSKVDAECFAKAVADQFLIPEINLQWSAYDNVTDSGIAQTLYREKFGELPTQADTVLLKERFLKYLHDAFDSDRTSFRQISGASVILDRLSNHPDWSIAYATGAWRDSAIFKLQRALLPFGQIPLSSSDDAIERSVIVKLAIERSKQSYTINDFERTVFVGDGVWDAKVAILLDLPFIGLGQRDQFDDFANISVLTDFLDIDRFLELLESASVPQIVTSHAHFA